LTNRDLRFERDTSRPIHDVMTADRLITCPPGTGPERAKDLMQEHKIEKLLVVDEGGWLQGLITIKDIESAMRHPDAARDEHGQLICAAAVGAGADGEARVSALLDAGTDVIVLDSAHGHSEGILAAARRYRSNWPDIRLVVGNVATAEATAAAIAAGADAVKVGIGPGSICTTRVVAGVGVPQLTAIQQCAEEASKSGRPIIADGGVKYSGDAAKALAAGASSVMIGSMLAGTDESPGDVVLYQGRRYKVYRGMGSLEAMQAGSSDRYFQEREARSTSGGKLVPEGIVGRVPYKGPVEEVLFQLCGGIRAAMGYTGCPNITAFHDGSRFVRISSAGLRESHVHDVVITAESPNYRVG
jgi:IMP dehydrogenase